MTVLAIILTLVLGTIQLNSAQHALDKIRPIDAIVAYGGTLIGMLTLCHSGFWAYIKLCLIMAPIGFVFCIVRLHYNEQ